MSKYRYQRYTLGKGFHCDEDLKENICNYCINKLQCLVNNSQECKKDYEFI